MTTWTSITARIRACASPKGREQTGAISLEGTRLFERADRAGVRFEHVLVARSFGVGSEREARLLERLRSVAPVTEIPNEAMRELTGGRGIGAICGLAEHPRVPSLDDLLQGDAERRATFLGLVDVEDPGNVGALARTAHAAGARALVTVGGVDAFHPKAIRTSMGSLFRLPVIRFDALSAVVAAFTARGIRSFGATSSSGERVFDADGLTESCCVFLGSEAFGLSAEAIRQLDGTITIPMEDGVDSLSVNAAAAVCLFEVRRRRLAEPQ